MNINEIAWSDDGTPSTYCGWCGRVHELIRRGDTWTCAVGARIDDVIDADLVGYINGTRWTPLSWPPVADAVTR